MGNISPISMSVGSSSCSLCWSILPNGNWDFCFDIYFQSDCDLTVERWQALYCIVCLNILLRIGPVQPLLVQLNSIFLKRIKLHLSEACTKLNHSILHFKHFKFYFCNPILKDSRYRERFLFSAQIFHPGHLLDLLRCQGPHSLQDPGRHVTRGGPSCSPETHTSPGCSSLAGLFTDPVVFCMMT